MPTLHDILISPALCLRYLPGRSGRLVVCFSGVGTKRGEEPAVEFYKMASNNGENHVLFVTDKSRSWLNSLGMADTIATTIREFMARFDLTSLHALGNSMGGTMALHLAQSVEFDNVIAIAPQFSVDPNIVPEETRWKHFRKQIPAFIYPKVEIDGDSKTQFYVMHGGSYNEQIHAQHFPMNDATTHIIFPALDHNLAKTLHQNGDLKNLVLHGLNSRRWRFRRHAAALGGVLRARHDADQRNAA